MIDSFVEAFNIKRSLSKKGCSYDNAVAEAVFKVFKTEFIYQKSFQKMEDLELHLNDYVNWYNNHRIHSSLGYLTPAEFRKTYLKKIV